MKGTQTSQRNLFPSRFLILMLMVVLLIAGCKNTGSGNCYDACQQNFSSCLQAAQGDPVQESRCHTNYDKCGADCM
jgi:hypothetical protein